MKRKTQIILQLSLWLIGMFIIYFIDGDVLMGGIAGATVGLLLVIIYQP